MICHLFDCLDSANSLLAIAVPGHLMTVEEINKWCMSDVVQETQLLRCAVDEFSGPLIKVVIQVQDVAKFIGTGRSIEEAKMIAFDKMLEGMLDVKREAEKAIAEEDTKQLEYFKNEVAFKTDLCQFNIEPCLAARVKLLRLYKSSKCHSNRVLVQLCWSAVLGSHFFPLLQIMSC